jgi:hypothetical protein
LVKNNLNKQEMIRIANFEVDCDAYSFTIKEIGIVADKESKNAGGEYTKNVTYHMNVEQVVDKLLELGLKNYIDTNDFGVVLVYMQSVKKKVKEIIELKKK